MLSEDQALLDAFLKGLILKSSRTPPEVVDLFAKYAGRIPVMQAFTAGEGVGPIRLFEACYDQCERQPATPEGKEQAKKFEAAGEWASDEHELQTAYRELREAVLNFTRTIQAVELPVDIQQAWYAQAITPATEAPVHPRRPRP